MSETLLTNDRDEPSELAELIAKFWTGEADQADANRLETLVLERDQIALEYVEHMRLSANLRLLNAPSAPPWCEPQRLSPLEQELLATSATNGQSPQPTAALAATPHQRRHFGLHRGFNSLGMRPWPVSMLVAAGVLTVTLLILSVLIVPQWNRPFRPDLTEVETHGPVVAAITALHRAQWSGPEGGVKRINRKLEAGRSVNLLSGFAEITFHSGTKVLLQGPCEFELQSENSAALHRGQLVAHVPENAKGFKIQSPQFTVVDLGTEFGMKVDPNGESLVQVFAGLVEVRPSSGPQAGPSKPIPAQIAGTQQLEQDQALRISPNGSELVESKSVDLKFVRSLEEVTATVAFWRFETPDPGERLPHVSGERKNNTPAATDYSGSRNHLYAFSEHSAPRISDNVAVPLVHAANATNRACLEVTNPSGERELERFLESDNRRSRATRPLETFAFEAWTIEASFLVRELDRYHAIVGKDGKPTDSVYAPLQLKIRKGNDDVTLLPVLQMEILDGGGDVRDVRTPEGVAPNVWYRVAVTCDGSAMRMYVMQGDETDYRLVDETPVNGALLVSSGMWSVGRGYCDNEKRDYARALIDEVRISRVALEPEQFLHATEE